MIEFIRFLKIFLSLFYVCECFAFLYGCAPHTCMPCTCWSQVEGFGSPRTEVASGSEPRHACWETDSGPLKKQQMLLATELLLQTKLNLFLLYLSFQEMYSFRNVYSIVMNTPYHRQILKQMCSS